LLSSWFIYIRAAFKKYIKYRGYKVAGNNFGSSMQPFIDYIRENITLKVDNIFEIGANFGQDAEYLMNAFKISPQNVYVFEAHPEIYKAILKLHKFNAYNYAVFNDERDMIFNICPLNSESSGWSSIYKHKSGDSKEVTVKAIRMDNFMNINKIAKIDFLKLDVEGASYVVLDGFGSRIKDINAIHVEAEHLKLTSLENLVHSYDDISLLLSKNGFELIWLERFNHNRQSDSFWIKKEFIEYV
jgi:FkbM family methyltransferase